MGITEMNKSGPAWEEVTDPDSFVVAPLWQSIRLRSSFCFNKL